MHGATGCSWAFMGGEAGMRAAHHLAGALAAVNPGLELKIYSTGPAPVLFL